MMVSAAHKKHIDTHDDSKKLAREHQENLQKRILDELEKGDIIVSTHMKGPVWLSGSFILLFKLMNKLRKRQHRYFRSDELPNQEINKATLEPDELKRFELFEYCRTRCRKLNYYYTEQYSGSYKLNYNLAYIAVTLAVISLFLVYLRSQMSDEFLRYALTYLVFGLGACKLVLLILIVINTWQANDADFNQRAIAVRYVMEHFRAMAFLSVLGIRNMAGSTAKRPFVKEGPMSYLENFIARNIQEVFEDDKSPGSVIPDDIIQEHLVKKISFIQENWVEAQFVYQTNRQIAQRGLHEKLERYSSNLNKSVLIFVGIDLLIGLAEIFHLFPEPVADWVGNWATPLILVIAAIFPAMVASFNGIKSQTEARKLAERSEHMTSNLNAAKQMLKELPEELKSLARNKRLARTQREAKEIALIMLAEVTEWTLIFAREVIEV